MKTEIDKGKFAINHWSSCRRFIVYHHAKVLLFQHLIDVVMIKGRMPKFQYDLPLFVGIGASKRSHQQIELSYIRNSHARRELYQETSLFIADAINYIHKPANCFGVKY